VQMSESVSLRDVPGRFLDQRKWRALRKFASQELIALTYINAPYPESEQRPHSGMARHLEQPR
jgi:hypothetical protein